MIVEAIIIAVAVIVVACIINGTEDYLNRNNTMSFRESMDLVELPIVTFYNGDAKFNFILDSGASLSVLNTAVLEEFSHTKLKSEGTVFGMEGTKMNVPYISAALKYKEREFEEVFQVIDMNAPFRNIKEDYGVNVHGILGNNFFKKYRYILDFDKLIAYTKV